METSTQTTQGTEMEVEKGDRTQMKRETNVLSTQDTFCLAEMLLKSEDMTHRFHRDYDLVVLLCCRALK